MTVPGSWRGVVNRHKSATPEVAAYFEHLPKLVEELPLEVCLSYMFGQVELAQNLTLYCGVVKLHRANATVARNAIDANHLTRKGFEDLFERVFGRRLTDTVVAPLRDAEKIRDRVMHGKRVTEAQKREAIVKVLDYAVKYNAQVSSLAGFQPFKKDLRGVKGRTKPLEASTTRWMLKGMGFGIP